MISYFFIQRPIFAAVLSIVVVLAGLIALRILPVTQYPDITPPTVQISASYPGASAETLARTVATPIEEKLSSVENLLYFKSDSTSDGRVTITATFEIGSDPDKAVQDVNNIVQQASPRLPNEVRRNGVVVEKRSENFLLVIALSSPNRTHDKLYISHFATQGVIDLLQRIPGVANAEIFGGSKYSMRVWLQPDRMALLGITVSDIQAAIASQNNQYAVGKIGAAPTPEKQALTYSVTGPKRLNTTAEFENIILRSDGPKGLLRLKDVARIELGAETYQVSSEINEKPMLPIAIFLQPGANNLQVGAAVKAKLDELQRESFPHDLEYTIAYDTTIYVETSVREVIMTVFEAAIIVLLVVFLFLQTWRATLIPMLAVPVSLIGTFAGLLLFGFSINTLTLFAMVLAIGIVVDDAIVVLENVERLMRDERMSAMAASVKAMREVSGAVVSIVLVLCAVFIPVAFLGGIAGQLYRQFAVTVAIAVVISGFVALTLTPALCAALLVPHHSGKTRLERFFGPFNRMFERLTDFFVHCVSLGLKYKLQALAMFVGTLSLLGILMAKIPSSFVPEEDQGYIVATAILPEGAALQRTERVTRLLHQQMKGNDAIESFFVINGFNIIGGGSKSNAATMFLLLKHWSERDQSSYDVIKQFSAQGMMLNDGIAFAFNPPSIQGMGEAGGFEVYLESRGSGDPQQLAEVARTFINELSQSPVLAGVQTFYTADIPQLEVEVDREKALSLGVPVEEIFTTLQTQLGSLYVNDFDHAGRTYRVIMQADAPHRSNPNNLGQLYVRSQSSGEMVPLKVLVQVRSVAGVEQVEHYNGYLSAKVLGSAKPGHSSGEAIAEVERIAKASLPPGYAIEWTGKALQEKNSGGESLFAFGLALIMVYLILAALYERWGIPMAVALAIPFAVVGALIAIYLRGMENDIYFQIGLIVLIGLSAKNAILIAEFAMQAMESGKNTTEAATEAARLRFRPIVMTSLAFILGVTPLVFAEGAGAGARQSMGTGVFGGMIVATFIAPMFVPLFFSLLARKPRPHHPSVEAVDSTQTGPETQKPATS